MGRTQIGRYWMVANCNLGMLNRLRDPMYRESGAVNHNTAMTQRRHLSGRPIRNEDGSLIESASEILRLFFNVDFEIYEPRGLERICTY